MLRNEHKPLISVILAVFNDEKNITHAITSILDQTYRNIELLIIDDCSTDKTLDKINSFDDTRIKVFKNESNLGLTKSLNLLINHSIGDLIARQDSDDISYPERLEKQLKFLIKKDLDACATRAFVKNSRKGRPFLTHLLPVSAVLKFKNPFIHGTLLIKTKVIKSVGLYNEEYKYAQDYKLYLDLKEKNFRIKIMSNKLYTLNTKNNISSKNKKEQEYFFKLAKKVGRRTK